MKYAFAAVLFLFIASPVSAQTAITRDGRYVYFRTPFSDLSAYARTAAVKESMQATIEALEESIPNKDGELKKKGALAVLTALKASYNRMDDLLLSLNEYLRAGKKLNILDRKGRPSAFMLHMGGKGEVPVLSRFVKTGGSASFGIVIVPVKVERVDMITKIVDRYFEFDTNWIIWPNFDLSASTDPGIIPKFRMGFGLIWGELEKAKDFVGAAFGLSVSTKGYGPVGANIKTGFLLSPKPKNFFVAAHLEFGAKITTGPAIDGHVNAAAILDANKLLGSFIPEASIPQVEYHAPPSEQKTADELLRSIPKESAPTSPSAPVSS